MQLGQLNLFITKKILKFYPLTSRISMNSLYVSMNIIKKLIDIYARKEYLIQISKNILIQLHECISVRQDK